VSGAGGVARINVAVVVRSNQDQDQLDRLRDVVALAAGIDRQRGDAVSVYALDQLANPVPVAPAMPTAAAPAVDDTPAPAPAPASGTRFVAPLLLAALVAVVGAAAVVWTRRGRARPQLRQLTVDERRAVLAQVNAWLETPRQAVREDA
jgi:flagellar M-ring protein FliF